MKALAIICVFAASSAATAGTPRPHCAFNSTYEVTSPQTVQEIERAEIANLELIAKDSPGLPVVPFAYQNAEWVRLKSLIRPGDKIVHFQSDPASWRHRAGEMGVALVRSCRVINQIVTLRN